MAEELDVDQIARDLQMSIALLRRRVRQVPASGELSFPETAALARLARGGPSTSAALARLEQISPQSMGQTLSALEARGLVERAPDPDDGRLVVLSISIVGIEALRVRRTARVDAISKGLAIGFTRPELRQLKAAAPLIERLAQSL
jgi:DNA-binding MarR family transcriptional regulator